MHFSSNFPDENDSPGVPGGALSSMDAGESINAPAFRLWGADTARLPVLIAAPHGGRNYPPALLAQLRQPAESCLRLEDRHVDTLAHEVARMTGAALLVAEAPRALIDLNRAPDDVDWGMVTGGKTPRSRHSIANRRARGGLGLVPRRLPGIGDIWREPVPIAELERRIADIHQPYHRALGETLEHLRDQWGAALLIDLHSMPPLLARPPEVEAAEYVIGDRFGSSCDGGLVAASLKHLASHGRLVAHNRPYSGGYVLDFHAAPRRGLHALQIEVCRASYLDARLDAPSARIAFVARLLASLVRSLADDVSALGRDRYSPLAAE